VLDLQATDVHVLNVVTELNICHFTIFELLWNQGDSSYHINNLPVEWSNLSDGLYFQMGLLGANQNRCQSPRGDKFSHVKPWRPQLTLARTASETLAGIVMTP